MQNKINSTIWINGFRRLLGTFSGFWYNTVDGHSESDLDTTYVTTAIARAFEMPRVKRMFDLTEVDLSNIDLGSFRFCRANGYVTQSRSANHPHSPIPSGSEISYTMHDIYTETLW